MLLPAAALLQVLAASPGIPDAATATGYVEQCIAATDSKRVDLPALEAQGWTSLNIRSRKGKPLPTAAYMRSSDMSALSASANGAKAIECVVLIPTNGPERAVALRDALSLKFEQQPVVTAGPGLQWTAGAHRIAWSPMGDAAKPLGVKVRVSASEK